MQARGYPPESNAHGSGDEGKTQNDGRMLRREHVILARMSSKGEQVPDQFGGGEENHVSSGFTACEIPFRRGTIASFIGTSTRSLPYVRCAASLDTRRGRKLLQKWCGTFRSLLVCSGISRILR